jgi:site-specific recombinase XerD
VDPDEDPDEEDAGNEAARYYPEDRSPFRAELEVNDERFAQLREAVVLNYDFNTAAAYWGDLDDLRWWCLHEGINILNPTGDDIDRYLDGLQKNRYSPNTVARRLTTFRLFYDLLVEEGELARSPVAGAHRLRPAASGWRRPRLRQTQRDRLWAAARAAGARDEAVARLVVDGLSIAQLCHARVQDLSTDASGRQTITAEHRSVPRAMPLSEQSAAALSRSLGGRTQGPLFTNRAGKELSRSDAARILRRLGRQARLRDVWW